MKILLNSEEVEKITQLWYLKRQFEELFENFIDGDLYCSAHDRLLDYVVKGASEDELYYLEMFVKAYFKMEKSIVERRNYLIDVIQSDQFKEEKFINRIRAKKQLKEAQKMCDCVNEFEKEFYERVNISLLRVENERCAKENTEQEEQITVQ